MGLGSVSAEESAAGRKTPFSCPTPPILSVLEGGSSSFVGIAVVRRRRHRARPLRPGAQDLRRGALCQVHHGQLPVTRPSPRGKLKAKSPALYPSEPWWLRVG